MMSEDDFHAMLGQAVVTTWQDKRLEECSSAELLDCVETLMNDLETTRAEKLKYFSLYTDAEETVQVMCSPPLMDTEPETLRERINVLARELKLERRERELYLDLCGGHGGALLKSVARDRKSVEQITVIRRRPPPPPAPPHPPPIMQAPQPTTLGGAPPRRWRWFTRTKR